MQCAAHRAGRGLVPVPGHGPAVPRRHRHRGPPGDRPSNSPREVFDAADVVCTLTPSRLPIIDGHWFRPGQHINAVGAPPSADHREIDSYGLARARVVVDDYEISVQKSGESVLALAEGAIDHDHLRTELGQVITGEAPGRTSADQITLYNSVGVAIQDLAIARLLIERAREWGRGRELS